MSEIYVGDVGTEIELDCGIDTTTATQREIVARSPVGVIKTWPATQIGQNVIQYITQPGDIDVVGNWRLQARVAMPGWSGSGKVATLKVEGAL